ncbi:DNA-binding protein [Pseudomonas sp. MF5691]|uniref:DNA-binding protein n=1 Tax=Pseudomonas sp. MF5691 TaxID=2797526 RepID=UPI0018E80D93|nr:DNA-binding protein [Pseudomonas sp. MF5691]MBJ2290564.1 DNA-binding protein [Pseudomonas sp. MF5691]
MARGGINKALVQKARAALLARGVNPSIDAVRVELGNTGSKTTISRYMQELESTDVRSQADPDRLSDELAAMVSQLLKRVLEEGNAALEQERLTHEQSIAARDQRVSELEAELKKSKQVVASRDAALTALTEELRTSQSSVQAEITRNARISQSCADLELRIQEKDEQVRSLEEKHAHARDAMEHYRSAIKEQREQDQRRHETQLQQMQQETLQLQQTLMVRQDELTRLNRDNERLLGEARQQSKLALQSQDAVKQLEGDLGLANMATARAEGAKEMLQEQFTAVRSSNEMLSAEVTELRAKAAALGEELSAANMALETCRSQRPDTPSE